MDGCYASMLCQVGRQTNLRGKLPQCTPGPLETYVLHPDYDYYIFIYRYMLSITMPYLIILYIIFIAVQAHHFRALDASTWKTTPIHSGPQDFYNPDYISLYGVKRFLTLQAMCLVQHIYTSTCFSVNALSYKVNLHMLLLRNGQFRVVFDLQLPYYASQIGKTMVPTVALTNPDQNK